MFVLSETQVNNAKQIPTISTGSKQILGVSLITKHLRCFRHLQYCNEDVVQFTSKMLLFHQGKGAHAYECGPFNIPLWKLFPKLMNPKPECYRKTGLLKSVSGLYRWNK